MESKDRLLKLVVTAFLIALEIILTRFLSIQLPMVRIGFGFLPVAICGIVCGPVWAAAGYVIGDVVGVLLAGTGTPHPGLTFSALLTGLIFGLILHKKDITVVRVVVATTIVVLGVNLALDTYWLSQLMHQGILAMLPMRSVKAAIMLIVEPVLIIAVYKVIGNVSVVKRLRGNAS